MKSNKGITLIALVITIVVLIILASITISMTLGENGIFRRAKTAKEDYVNAQAREQKMINDLEVEMGKLVNGEQNGSPAVENITITFDANGGEGGTIKTIEKGQAIGTLPAEPTRDAYIFTGWFTASSGGTQITAETVPTVDTTYHAQWRAVTLADLKAGDWVSYSTGNSSVGTVPARVLYTQSSIYGLQIITQDCMTDITLGHETDFDASKTSYNNAIVTLNNACQPYFNSNYVYDYRCVGSIPTRNSNGIFTVKNSDSNTYILGVKDKDENYKTDYDQLKTFNGLFHFQDDFWMASRWNSINHFYIRMNRYFESVNALYILYSDGSYRDAPRKQTGGLRPVFSLRSDVMISGGDGTEDSPYVLTK